MVRESGEHPEAVIPELSVVDPVVTFTASDITLVYGSKWTKRYFKKVGDAYSPSPPSGMWTDHYPPDNMKCPPDHCAMEATRQLRHSNEIGDGVECGLREMPWPGRRASGEALADQHCQSRRTRWTGSITSGQSVSMWAFI